MICPICGDESVKKSLSRHLPLFYQCMKCGGYVHQEGLPPEYEQSYFVEQEKTSIFSKLFTPFSNFFLWLRLRTIRKALGQTKGEILDYGCGNAKLVQYLRAKGLEVDGYDPSQSAVQLSQKVSAPVFNEIPEKQYEMIMFWHSLEHSDTPQADLKKSLRFLKPDGKLLIAVPNGESLEAKASKENWFCYDWPFHRIHFTPSSLKVMLQGISFKIRSTNYLNLEYTVSSLVQTFLNLFLPKNALYSALTNRRIEGSQKKLVGLVLLSCVLLLVFSPILLVFFLVGLITKRSSAVIIVAVKNFNRIL